MATERDLLFCIPVFNDWKAAAQLVELIDDALAGFAGSARVLFVDDGSTDTQGLVLRRAPRHLRAIEVLPLRRNLGHQRAIAIGLTYIYEHRPCDAVVVMDGDGEDAPRDVPTLLARLKAESDVPVVFAQRARRSEGLGFRLGYLTFRLLHRVLTGRGVEVGNFSVIPRAQLSRLVGVSEIWNHYAAAVFKARLPTVLVPIPRAKRLDGRSQMSFVSLVTHGLSAISVYGETVGVRLLVFASFAMLLSLLGIGIAVGIRLGTDLAIPGWATNVTGLLLLSLLALSLVLAMAVLFVLQSRDRYSFLPLRDYPHYVMEPLQVFG